MLCADSSFVIASLTPGTEAEADFKYHTSVPVTLILILHTQTKITSWNEQYLKNIPFLRSNANRSSGTACCWS